MQVSPPEQVRRDLSPLVQEREGRKPHSKVGLIHAAILAIHVPPVTGVKWRTNMGLGPSKLPDLPMCPQNHPQLARLIHTV